MDDAANDPIPPFVPPTEPPRSWDSQHLAPRPPAGAFVPPASPTPPAAPTRASMRRRSTIGLLIVVGSIVLLALLGWGISAVATTVAKLQNWKPSGGQELLSGDPGSPLPVDPLECTSACFSIDDADALVPSSAALTEIGLTDTTFPHGTYDPTSVGELYRSHAAGWAADRGTPDTCFFSMTNSPLSGGLDPELATVRDLVDFLGTYEDPRRRNLLDQSMRVFPDSASASSYLAGLSEAIGRCPELAIGPESNRYRPTIDPEAALPSPDSVAAVGWVRTGDPGLRWRAYIVDLQRGNLVVRTRLLTDGSITETQFRSWVQAYSLVLASVPPAETTAPQ